MKTIDFSYFIERYNAGEMSEAEKQWFQKELEGNDKLRNEVHLRKRTDEILKNQNVISLRDRKSTRLNSSHANISYAVFCLKKKQKKNKKTTKDTTASPTVIRYGTRHVGLNDYKRCYNPVSPDNACLQIIFFFFFFFNSTGPPQILPFPPPGPFPV